MTNGLKWIIWLPCWIGAIGLWGMVWLGDQAKVPVALGYLGGASAFLYAGSACAYYLFAWGKARADGITTAPDESVLKSHWGSLVLAGTGVPAFAGGLAAIGLTTPALVFCLLAAGYPTLTWLAKHRNRRSRLVLFRRSSGASAPAGKRG